MPIARFAVTRRVSVAMIAAAIIVLGIFALPRLPVDLLPTFQPPVVGVTVNYGNVSPETIESTVTRPLENAVARVAGIDYLQSNSTQGQSSIRVQFKFGTDINVAVNDIEQQVARARAQLPNDPNLQAPQIAKADFNAAPVTRYYVTDPTRTQRDLNDLFTNVLADQFSAVSGVGSVQVDGGQVRAIMVAPDQTKLAGYGLTNNDVIKKIANENVDFPAGLLTIGPREFGIRTSALYKSAAEVGDAVITVRGGVPVYLRSIAKISDSIEEQRVYSRLDGVPAISMIVTAQPDANIVSVADGIREKVATVNKEYPSIKFGAVFEQRDFILEAINALEHTAILGAVLAVLIILLFLHSWRSTLIVAVSLPVSVCGTLFAAYLAHQTLNTMTLGGLALAIGLIVDDAVVVIENIFRHLDEGETALDAARNATSQIFSAVLSSTITVVTVFVPLLLIPGLQGLIFGPFALTVMTGVAISLLVAVTTVPMLASILIKPAEAHAGGRFSHAFDRQYARFENRYRAILAWTVDRPLLVVVTGAVLLGATVLALVLGAVQTEVFPASNSRFARFDIRTPNGSSLAYTDLIARRVEAALRSDARVENVGTTVGSSFGGGGAHPITNRASLAVTLRPGTSGEAAGAFVGEWQGRLGGRGRNIVVPTATPAPGSPEAKRRATFRGIRKALAGTVVAGRTIDILQQQIAQGSDALTIQIYGPDIRTLYNVAQAALPKLAVIPGVTRPDTNITANAPEIDVRIDRRKAAQLGFSTGDIAADIATATSGTIASYFQVNGVQYPIFVQAESAQRQSLAALGNLALVPPTTSSSPSLASVPLSAVATIAEGTGPSQISRQNKQRRIDIFSNVQGQPLGVVVAAARQVMENYPLPAGYRWQFGPEIAQNNDTFGALALVVILAIALIYMLLASQFESFLDPIVIMVAVPLALVGVTLSLVLTHRAFGLTAFIGGLMLVGIAVKNAILVIEFTKQLRRDGMDPREALLHAGPRRLRPILMTTFATIGGMLPLALGIEAGSSTQAPLGTVVIGGLISSTILSLLVVPTLYLWTATHVEPRFRAKPPRVLAPPLVAPVGTPRAKAGVYK